MCVMLIQSFLVMQIKSYFKINVNDYKIVPMNMLIKRSGILNDAMTNEPYLL